MAAMPALRPPRPAPAAASRTRSRALLRSGLVVLLGLPLAACGEDAAPVASGPLPSVAAPSLPAVAPGVRQPGEPRLISVLVDGVRVQGVGEVVEVPRSTRVRLVVTADVADVLVVQGYDVRARLTVDEPQQLTLLLDRAGEFEVALEGAGRVLTRLRVT